MHQILTHPVIKKYEYKTYQNLQWQRHFRSTNQSFFSQLQKLAILFNVKNEQILKNKKILL